MIIRVADDVAGDEEVLADEGFAGIALGVLGIVDVLGDDDEAGVARLLDGGIERVRNRDGREHGVLLVGNRGLDEVRGAGGVAVGVDIGKVDVEQAGRFLGAELHRLEEGGARAAVLDEGHLDRRQVLGLARLRRADHETGRIVASAEPRSIARSPVSYLFRSSHSSHWMQ